jgi:hypothetical protein
VIAVAETTGQAGTLIERWHPELTVGARLSRSGTSWSFRHQAFDAANVTATVQGIGALPRVITARRSTSGVFDSLWVHVRADGDPEAVGAVASATTPSLGNLGGTLRVGNGLEGDVAEVLGYDRVLELDELVEVQAYLVAKYALEAE